MLSDVDPKGKLLNISLCASKYLFAFGVVIELNFVYFFRNELMIESN